MAVRSDLKTRITITITNEQADILNHLCAELGMTRSSLCAYILANGIVSMKKSFGLIDQMSSALSQSMDEMLTNEMTQRKNRKSVNQLEKLGAEGDLSLLT